MLRRLLPAGAEPDFRDPSGTIRVDHIPAPTAWVGHQTVDFQTQTRSRIAWIDRLGEGMLPSRDSVIQEGDLLHLVMREEHAATAYQVIHEGPED
jgi:trk system potassium uptake protein TrkA